MKLRWLLIGIIVFLFGICHVDAVVCDAEDMARAKAFAEGLTPTYQYAGHSGDWQAYFVQFDFGEYAGQFSFAESNMQGAIASDGGIFISSGQRSIDIFYNPCANYKIATISVELPYFNRYSVKTECEGLEDVLDVCNPNYHGKITESDFYETVEQYVAEHEEKSFDLFEFVKKYYFYFIGGCIFLILLIIYLVIQHNKHYKLD